MCEICRSYPCHPRCPNHIPPKTSHYCSICKEGIYDGEEYIENSCGEYAHWNCVDYGRDLVDFLGYEIKEMDNENEWDY